MRDIIYITHVGTLTSCNKPACPKKSTNDCDILTGYIPMLEPHMILAANKRKFKSPEIAHLD